MAEFDEQEYTKKKMLEAMENVKRRKEAIQDKARIAGSIYDETPSNVIDLPEKKIPTSKKLETLSGINQALENPEITGQQKLQLRDYAAKLLKEEGYTDDQLKYAKGRMKSKIDRGNFKKFGAIASEGIIGDSIKKAGMFAGKIGKKGLKAIPLIGPIVTAAMTGDAAAGIPLLGEADEVGAPTIGRGEAAPRYDFNENFVKEGESDDEARARIEAIKSLKNRFME